MISTYIDGHVGVIEFNRPKANAYNLSFMQALNEALDGMNENADVRVICMQSAVSGFFCAGADIKEFADNDTEQNRCLVELANSATAKMQASPKLVVCAVNGHALGGGLELMLAADLRIGSDANYKLGMSEVALGLMPGNGGTQRFARIVGLAAALEYCVSGEYFGPQKAKQIGLYNQLLSADDFNNQAKAYCQRMAKGAPLAIAAIKQSLYQGAALDLPAALTLEKNLADSLYDTYDANEGLMAFIEKRDAKFKGR